MDNNLDYGKCMHCERIMSLLNEEGEKNLVQIRYYEGHLYPGKFHHKLLCIACKEAADDIFRKEKQ